MHIVIVWIWRCEGRNEELLRQWCWSGIIESGDLGRGGKVGCGPRTFRPSGWGIWSWCWWWVGLDEWCEEVLEIFDEKVWLFPGSKVTTTRVTTEEFERLDYDAG